MTTFYTSCMSAIRNLPQGSAIDVTWRWMEERNLTESSILSPEIDLINEVKITQNAARLFFGLLLPEISKLFGFANLGLGTIHLVWCVINIRKIRNNKDGCSSQDVEKALIRLWTGVYDLAIAYILCSLFTKGKYAVPIVFAFFPTYAIQLHHLIFEKEMIKIAIAVKEGEEQKFTYEIDHRALKVSCLIKQFSSGLIETFIPPPEILRRVLAPSLYVKVVKL